MFPSTRGQRRRTLDYRYGNLPMVPCPWRSRKLLPEIIWRRKNEDTRILFPSTQIGLGKLMGSTTTDISTLVGLKLNDEKDPPSIRTFWCFFWLQLDLFSFYFHSKYSFAFEKYYPYFCWTKKGFCVYLVWLNNKINVPCICTNSLWCR